MSNKDLTGYSFNIESRGRGHDMFRFNNIDEPFFVTTYGEVYMIDKEYITVKRQRNGKDIISALMKSEYTSPRKLRCFSLRYRSLSDVSVRLIKVE